MHLPAKSFANTLLIICMISLMSGCGFHLKGYRDSQDSPVLTELHIKGNNRFDDIAAEVKQQAKARNIKVTSKADWSIRISDEIIETWQTSSTQSYTTNDYYVRIIITYEFIHEGLNFKPVTLFEEAIFQDNSSESSSKTNERDILLQQLRETLAESILRRLEQTAKNSPACETHDSKTRTTP